VAAVYTAEEILEITGGRLAAGLIPTEAGAISTDTRSLNEGDWFLALPGRKYDGHDFLGDAFAGGAIGCIVAERTSYPIASTSFPLISVMSTDIALSMLACNWRNRIIPQVLLFCGESGELKRLVELIRAAAGFSEMKVCSLPCCIRAEEACTLLLDVPADTKLVIVGLCPLGLRAIEQSGYALKPNVLSLLPLAFDNLRLTCTREQVADAKIALVNNLNRTWAWLLAPAAGEEMSQSIKANQQANLLLYRQRYFDNPEQQGRKVGATSVETYETALESALRLLSVEEAWTCVNASALVGIDLFALSRAIDEQLRLSTSEQTHDYL
jgi:hypothetical protein